MNIKEETLRKFVPITSKNSTSGVNLGKKEEFNIKKPEKQKNENKNEN